MFWVLLSSTWPQIWAKNGNLRISKDNSGEDSRDSWVTSPLVLLFPPSFKCFYQVFSRSKKSINIKTHKAERFVNINEFLTGWWWLAGELQDGGVGMRTVNSNNTTDHSKRPLSQITSDFWSPAGNFQKARTIAVFLRSVQPFSSPHSFPKHIHLAKALH